MRYPGVIRSLHKVWKCCLVGFGEAEISISVTLSVVVLRIWKPSPPVPNNGSSGTPKTDGQAHEEVNQYGPHANAPRLSTSRSSSQASTSLNRHASEFFPSFSGFGNPSFWIRRRSVVLLFTMARSTNPS